MTTKEVAEKLIAMCREGKINEAKDALYADDIVSIEPVEGVLPKEAHGMAALRKKDELFTASIDHFYSSTISDPVVAGDFFAVSWDSDLQMKGQPRQTISEICVYKVKDGKVVSEQFFF